MTKEKTKCDECAYKGTCVTFKALTKYTRIYDCPAFAKDLKQDGKKAAS